MQHTHRILDSNYQNDDKINIVLERKHSSNDNEGMLYNVLPKYELFFNGTIETWKNKKIDIEL